MIDRELLELAAKAAGIKASWQHLPDADYDAEHDGMWFNGERTPDNSTHWNPLRRDGDALRLAVKLRMPINFGQTKDTVSCWYAQERYDSFGDAFAMTRRAIVRAAADIGKDMP